MKKKIILTLAIVMALACLFAIGVSAARVEDYEDTFTLVNSSTVQHYERHYYNETQYHKSVYIDSITVRFIDEDGNDVTSVPMWEYDEEEGRYYSLVWYISASQFEKETATTTISDVEYTYDKYTSAVYTLSKVRALDIRYDFTYSESWSFSTSSVGYDYTYKVENPLWGMFLDVNNTPDNKDDDYVLQASRGIGRDTADYGFIGWDAQFAAQGNKIVVANLRDCDFDADCTGNYGTKNTWSLATNLQCLWYPDTVKYLCGGTAGYEIDIGDGVEIINCQVLRSNKKVKEFVIPNSCIYLGNESFRETDLTKLTIGEGLITCPGNNAFLYTGGADYIVVSKNITENLLGSLSSIIANQSATIYFDGSHEEATAFMNRLITENSNYNGKVTLVDYNTTIERGEVKNVCLFYNYNRCDAFYYGNHELVVEEGNTCSGVCKKCQNVELIENPVHNNIWIINNGNTVSYFEKFGAVCECKFCHTIEEEKTVPAIVTTTGYSTAETGESGIYQVVRINKEALTDYAAMLGVDFEYGVLAGIADYDAENSTYVDGSPITIDAETGKLSSSETSVIGTFADTNYTVVAVKLVGVNKTTAVYCGAFVVLGNDIRYISGSEEDSVAKKYEFVK